VTRYKRWAHHSTHSTTCHSTRRISRPRRAPCGASMTSR
jgi:hypothetical protein